MSTANPLRVSTRIQLLVGLTLAGLLCLCLTALFQLKSTMLEDRKDKLQSQVESAVSVLKHFHTQATDGKLSDEDARRAAREALRGVRYSGNEYFFIYNMEGLTFMHPIKPDFEGQSKWDLKDAKGKLLIRELAAAAGKGGGFVDFMWDRSKELPPEPKLAYAAPFAPWNLMVGTGVFVDDIDKAYQSIAWIFGGIFGGFAGLAELFRLAAGGRHPA